MKNTLFAWRMIEKILKNKPDLIYYDKGGSFNKILENAVGR